MLKKILSVIALLIIATIVVVVVLICMITPEKTMHGTYTNPYKYWTDDAYLCANFKCDNIEK